MKTTLLGLGLVLLLSTASSAQTDNQRFDEAALREDARKTLKTRVASFAKKYCIDCHGPRPEGGINLQSALDSPESATSFLHWKKAAANVKVHDMPPEDSGEIPTNEERENFIAWISKLKYMAERDPGPFVMRRLSKVEYRNTLHDLYGVAPSVADSLPEEVVGEGYLNSISPMQSELFFDITNKVIAQVIPYDGLPVRQAPSNDDEPEVRNTTSGQDVDRITELQRLFRDTPPYESEYRSRAGQVARTLARAAYRRPPTDAELDVLVGVFDLGRENELSYTASLALMWKAVLVSPQFLFITPVPYDGLPFRREASSVDAMEIRPTGDIQPLDAYQLASRLSYLLWSAPPDAELSALADNGQLQEPEVLRAQVERLLKHERSRALFDSFGAQWLGVSGLQSQAFDPEVFPQMTADLRTAMMEEARLFFDSIVQENQSVSQLVDNDYTFLNEPLATLYGLGQSIVGPTMQRITLENPNRGGILGMPAILAATSLPNRTSPVKRGVWVLEQVLGERVPPPPPDVPELEDQKQDIQEGLTLRERTELHKTDPNCANCHKVLDPIGFGLENFDAIGRWRDQDEGTKIDSSGELPSGEAFSTPADLKRILAKREADLARNLTQRLMSFALGRQLQGYDEVVIDQLMVKIAEDDYRVRTIITEVTTSYLFTHRRVR